MKIKKDEFDNLPDALKPKFKAIGDDYELIEEDTSGLKKSKEDLLVELKTLKEKFNGIDPDEATAALAAAKAAAEEGLAKRGEYETLLKEKEAAWQKRIDDLTADKTTILQNLKSERVKTLCAERGILPERVRSAIAEGDLDNIFELESGESGFSLKKKGGIGDAADIDAIFTELKTKAPWTFAADNASGSGASGSGNTGGTTAKRLTQAEVSNLSPSAKREFYLADGEVTDQ